MASKKLSQHQHRTKEGLLELKKGEGMKKVWRSYTFKVSASTYLLYFKPSDHSKPEGQVLLATVTQVLPSASKGARYPFEVHFKGKGSPWKLNASSNEERISWMESILPKSSQSLTHFKKMMEATPPPVPFDSPPPYSPPTLPPQPHPPASKSPSQPSLPPVHHLPANKSQSQPSFPPIHHSSPNLMADGEADDDFLSASLPAPPQDYLVPVTKRFSSERRAMDARPRSKSPQPSPRPRGSGKFRPVPPPRKTSGERSPVSPHPTGERPNGDIGRQDSEEDPYISMMSSPASKGMFPTCSLQPKCPVQQPKRQQRFDNEEDSELPDYLQVVSPVHEADMDENNYVLSEPASVPDNQRSGQYYKASPGVGPSVAGNDVNQKRSDREKQEYDLAETISRHFDHDQIGMLIEMLQQVRVSGKQSNAEIAAAWEVKPSGEGATSPTSPPPQIVYSEQDSITLRGNLQRALSYAPELTERILVTEEDSEESYEIRPMWAKAVNREPPQVEAQLDTLGDLQQQALHLSKADLVDFHLIGQGQFGKVYKGILKQGSESTPVAIKMTKRTISEYHQQAFMKEMSIMSQMMHPNIVRLYGLVTEDVVSPWIVLEYMKNGDLKTFLTDNERPTQQLVKYMIDIAMGMHYISERGLVHRDLAARNVLVGTNETCKVADFGLLREIPRDDSIYTSQHNVPCPIRWMPPESIVDRQFSPASDVWSFGVLVWEMFNPTKLPYEKYDNMGYAAKVVEGLRLPVPRGVPSVVAKIMKACWHKNPAKRPSFLLISTLLSTKTTF